MCEREVGSLMRSMWSVVDQEAGVALGIDLDVARE